MADALVWTPHAWQKDAIRRMAWRTVMVCARQMGKTTVVKRILAQEAGSTPNGSFMYISPTIDLGKAKYSIEPDSFKATFGHLPGWGWNDTDRRVTLPNKAIIEFKSFEQGMRAKGRSSVHGVVFDECGEMAGWFDRIVISPMLSRTQGWKFYLGTPPDPIRSPDPSWFEGLKKRAKQSDGWEYIEYPHTALSEEDPAYALYVQSEREGGMSDEEFSREYECKFAEPGEFGFKTDLIRYYTRLPKGPLNTAITIDPSWSESEAADPRAIATTGITANGDFVVLALDQGRWGYDLFLEHIFKAWQDAKRNNWNPRYMGVETTGSGPFKRALEREAEGRGIYIPIRDIRSYNSKYNRALTLQPWLREGRFFLKSGDPMAIMLEEQMAMFPRGLLDNRKATFASGDRHHYDLLDAVSFRTVDQHMPPRPRAEQPKPDPTLTFCEEFRRMKRPPSRNHRMIRT